MKYCGPVDLWTCGPVDLWTCGPVDPWTRGPVDPWTRGPVDLWTCGPVDLWTEDIHLYMPEFLKTGLAKIRTHSTTWQLKTTTFV